MALSANDAFAAGGGRRRRRGRGRRGALSEINVTPLVDVMLVLLIVFMISAPLLTAGVPVELPKTEAGAMQDQSEPLTVSIRADGSIYVQEDPVAFSGLAPRLQAMADGKPKPIYVRADGRAAYAVVAQVMASLSTSGFTSINLITETGGPSSGGNPDAPREAPAPVRRSEFSPYLLASLVLHLLVFAAAMVSWRMSRDLKVGAVVPVNLVSNAPATDLAPAVQAPEEQTAQTEDPVPDAPPEPASPTPEPTPKPPEPKPAPTPKAAPAAKTPPTPAPTPKAAPTKAAAKPTPKPAEKGLDLDALAASLKTSRPTGGRTSSATKGAARPQTATEARPALGTAQAAAAISGLSEELQRRWNPNCDVEGGRDVQLQVTFTLGAGGQVVGEPKPQIRSAPGAVAQAAAERAVRAVYAASPFRNLPREFYGQSVNVNFVAREACS